MVENVLISVPMYSVYKCSYVHLLSVYSLLITSYTGYDQLITHDGNGATHVATHMQYIQLTLFIQYVN